MREERGYDNPSSGQSVFRMERGAGDSGGSGKTRISSGGVRGD